MIHLLVLGYLPSPVEGSRGSVSLGGRYPMTRSYVNRVSFTSLTELDEHRKESLQQAKMVLKCNSIAH